MILLDHRVGRLLETRFSSPIGPDDLAEFQRQRKILRDKVGSERLVVMDFRKASVLPPNLADELMGLLAGPNPGLLRNGVLLPSESATAAMQLQRIVREANNDHRRTFRDADELEKWLGELLTPAERARLHEFLSG